MNETQQCLRCAIEIAEDVPMLPENDASQQTFDSGAVLTANGALYCAQCAPSVQICEKCGCTDEYGCDEGCSWVRPNLCSSCADPMRISLW